VLSRQVLDAAADSLGARPGTLTGDVAASVAAGTQVIEVTAKGPTPETAQRRAEAVTRTYLDLRESRAAQALEEGREAARTRVEDLTDQLRTARAEQAAAGDGSTEGLLLDAQIDALTTVLTQERARIYTLEGSAPTPGSLLGDPTPPVRGGFAPALLVIAGTVVGLSEPCCSPGSVSRWLRRCAVRRRWVHWAYRHAAWHGARIRSGCPVRACCVIGCTAGRRCTWPRSDPARHPMRW